MSSCGTVRATGRLVLWVQMSPLSYTVGLVLASRIRSWFIDYLVILAWLVLLALVVGLPSLTEWFDLDDVWSDRVWSDLAITLLTVVPLFVYLTVTESRPTHATVGKRRAGLHVTRVDGAVAGTAAVALRNLVKVLPWQIGHMGTARIVTGEAEGLGVSLNISALVLLAVVAGPPLVARRGLHDVLAGTEVSASE